MASKICRRCGGKTNTALCDWMDSPDEMADRCFMKFVGGEWVNGCAANDKYERAVIERGLLSRRLNKEQEYGNKT